MIRAIAHREFKALFRSPLAWIIAAVMQAVFAWMFLLTLEEYMNVQASLRTRDHAPGVTAYMTFRYMAPATSLFLVLCPLLSMRAFSDEFRMQTLPLLLSSPISATAVVLGKFTGTLTLIVLLSLLVVLMPLSLATLSGIDIMTLLLAWTGLLALGCCATAIGIFYSSLTRHSMIAAISSVATLIFLWLIGKGSLSDPLITEMFKATALSTHLGQVFQGIASTREFVYFGVLTFLFLALTIIRMDSYKYSRA